MGGRERGLQNSNTENIARMAGSKRQSGRLHPNVVWHGAGLGREWATLLLLCLYRSLPSGPDLNLRFDVIMAPSLSCHQCVIDLSQKFDIIMAPSLSSTCLL